MTHDRQQQDMGVGGVKKLILYNVMTNIQMSFLSDKTIIDPTTGLVIGTSSQLDFLHSNGLFPLSLKSGYKILEINAKIYNKVGKKDYQQYKEGLFGRDLIITYLEDV